jgi:glycosyltransferase involved in cell wall biosynthesis
MANPKVSVVTVSYNQEKYIAQAIESIMSQRTNFDFELIVADDASTDRTPRIVQDLANKYPIKIKPILRKKNLGVAANFNETMREAKGLYIALCEGDDYWTDTNKLQIQADMLDSNPDMTLCFHQVRVFFEHGEQEDYIYPKRKTKYDTVKLLEENFIQTNSVMYRKRDYKNLPNNILPIDWYLHLYHAQHGSIGFIPKVMSDYRRHAGGVWWNSYADISKIWEKYGNMHLNLFLELLKLFKDNREYKSIIFGHTNKILSSIISSNKKARDLILHDTPEYVIEYVFKQNELLQKSQKDLESESHLNQEYKTQLIQKQAYIERLYSELSEIKASRVWKMRNKAARLLGKKII